MTTVSSLHADSPPGRGLAVLLASLEAQLHLASSLPVFIAGPMAAHLHTGLGDVTTVDALFGARVLLPQDLAVEVIRSDGGTHHLGFTRGFSAARALLPDDFVRGSIAFEIGTRWLEPHVLSPLDVAVGLVASMTSECMDGLAGMAMRGLIDADAVVGRASGVAGGLVAGLRTYATNLDRAAAIIRFRQRTLGRRCQDSTCRPLR